MRHVKIIGLCLAAVMAILVVAVGSASASSPEWGKCVAKAGGKYTDSNCQTKGKPGSFEWEKGSSLPNVKFTSHDVGSGGVLSTFLTSCEKGGEDTANRLPKAKCEAEGGTWSTDEEEAVKIECESEHAAGEQAGKSGVQNVAVTFEGCKAFGALPCKSSGAAEEEININPLKGTLGYINKGAKTVGVLLEPVEKHGAFAKFECAEVIETVVGVGNKTEGAHYDPKKGGNDGIISPITPVNTMTSSFEQVYSVNPATEENIPSKFEGGKTALLEDYLWNIFEAPHVTLQWSAAGEEVTNVNTPEEPGEIKTK